MVTLVGRYNAASCRQSVITCLFNLRNPSSTGSLPLERPGHPELRTKMSFLLAPFFSLPRRPPYSLPRFSPRSCLSRRRRRRILVRAPQSILSPLGGQVMDDLGPRRVLMEQRFHASRTLVKHGLAAFFTHRPERELARA